jgi:hypothetical protein
VTYSQDGTVFFFPLFVVHVISICPCDEHFSNLSTHSVGAPSSVLCCEVEGTNVSMCTVEIWHSEGHDGIWPFLLLLLSILILISFLKNSYFVLLKL